METKIKSCPLCGQMVDIRIEAAAVAEDIMLRTNHYNLDFRCKNCGYIKSVRVNADTYSKAVDKAVEIWNASVNEKNMLKINKLDKFLDKEPSFPKIEKQQTVGEVVYKASIDIQKHINKQVEQCLIGFCETLKKKVKILPSLDYDYRSLRCVPDAKILFLDDVDETLKEVLGEKKD